MPGLHLPRGESRRLFAGLMMVAIAALALTLTAPPPARADEPNTTPGQESFEEWVANFEAFYAANPELKTTPGGGWKPYNRARWFIEQRRDGEDIPVMGRWNAFLRKRELEQARTKAAATQWFSLGPENFAGRMLDIEFDPNDTDVLYAGGAAGGIWKSTDGGGSWNALDDELPTLAVGAIAVLPSNSNVVIIGTGEATNNIDAVTGVGILRSTDAGATWEATDLSFSVSSGHGFHMMEANPFTDVVLAASTDGVYRSTDEGATWTQVRSGGDFTDVKFKPGSADIAYTVRTANGGNIGRVFKSTDGGATWSGSGSGLPSGLNWGKTRMAVTAADPEYVYIVFEEDGTGGLLALYRSTNSAANWSVRTTTQPGGWGAQAWYNLTLAADPNNAERIFCGATPLYRSTNGGSSLSQIAGGVHVDHHAIAYRPGSDDDLFVGSDGGIWESTDDGSSWSDRNSGLVTYQFYDICVTQADPLRAWGGTQDNGTDRWVNSPIWLQGLGADGMVCNGHPTNSQIVYGEIQNGSHRKSVNGGATWSSINSGITGNGNWVTAVDLDQNDGDHLYTATSDGLFRTLNGGSNWTNVTSGNATWISISPVDGDVVWATNPVRYTTDDGANWTDASAFPFPVGPPTKILAHPTDVNTALVTFSSYNTAISHIARTTDMGTTWEDVSGDFPPQPVNAIVIDPSNTERWFIGTDVGVWLSINEGANWGPFEVGFPNAVVLDLEIQDSGRKLRAGTHGRGMWEIDITSPTGVGQPVATAAPNLMFDPPAPNPVRDETVLRYAARSPEPVSLSIYDVQGRLVTVLAEHAADGIIRFARWRTDGVANGVYLALLRTGSEVKAQKLHVVK